MQSSRIPFAAATATGPIAVGLIVSRGIQQRRALSIDLIEIIR
jgi:hypothetical protein